MTSQTKKSLIVLSILALSLVIFTGSALAQTSPTGDIPGDGGWLGQMQQWAEQVHGPGSWGQMIQWMNQVHGPEFTGQMLKWMNETGGCHGTTSTTTNPMMGSGLGGMMGAAPWNSASGNNGGQ